MRGESDIAYIGKAGNKDGIKRRISQYYYPGHDNRTSLRMKEVHLVEHSDLVLGYRVVTGKEAAETAERELLRRFKEEHGELPPFNKTG